VTGETIIRVGVAVQKLTL